MTKKYFGTDGIRGRVGEYPITPEFMLKLGWAAGMAFRKMGACKVLVGKDTRISGYMFESALEAGLTSAGADVMLLGPMPTPAIAYLTRTFHAEAGIVISASHNPHDDNGIKFFSGKGTKLPDEVEHMIEELLDTPMTVVESSKIGKVSRINDASGRYIEFCKSSVPTGTSFAGMKIVIDCAHGATYKVAPSVFRELGADVVVLSAQPNGLNINDNCGSTHMGPLQAAVLAEHADLGIAFDGDGDRVLMVDHTGAVVDGDELLYIIARDLHERNCLKGGVVGTLMSNLGLELALADLSIPFSACQCRRPLCHCGSAGAQLAGRWRKFGSHRLLQSHHDRGCDHCGAAGADGAQDPIRNLGSGSAVAAQMSSSAHQCTFRWRCEPARACSGERGQRACHQGHGGARACAVAQVRHRAIGACHG